MVRIWCSHHHSPGLIPSQGTENPLQATTHHSQPRASKDGAKAGCWNHLRLAHSHVSWVMPWIQKQLGLEQRSEANYWCSLTSRSCSAYSFLVDCCPASWNFLSHTHVSSQEETPGDSGAGFWNIFLMKLLLFIHALPRKPQIPQPFCLFKSRKLPWSIWDLHHYEWKGLIRNVETKIEPSLNDQSNYYTHTLCHLLSLLHTYTWIHMYM